MKFAKENHPVEIALRQIEEILEKNNMTLHKEPYGGLVITYKKKEFAIRNAEDFSDERQGSQSLPRIFEEEKLIWINEEDFKPTGWEKV